MPLSRLFRRKPTVITMDNNDIKELISRAKEDRNFRKAFAKKHILFFAKFYFRALYLPLADFQKEMFNLADSDIGTVAVAAFRGSGKSLIFTQILPIFAIVARDIHNVLIVSGSQRQAEDHLANIKSSLENKSLLTSDFGPFKGDETWTKDSIIIPKYNAKITAVSLGQAIRGAKYDQYRPQLIICDDIEDVQSVMTAESREKTNHIVQSELIPLGEPGKTRLIFVGNLLHRESVMMRLKSIIEKNKIGQYRAYPLLDDNGKIAWPERYTPEIYKKERAKFYSPEDWEREMNLKIINPLAMVILRPEWITYYNNAKPPTGNYVVKLAIGVDPAFTTKSHSDYSAIVSVVVLKVNGSMKFYVYPSLIHRKMEFPELVQSIKGEYERLTNRVANPYFPVELFIEDFGSQVSIPQTLNADYSIPAQGFKPKGDKRSRAAELGRLVEKGIIVFPKTGCERLIQEMLDFGMELHEDLVDALGTVVFPILEKAKQSFHFPSFDYLEGEEANPSHEKIMEMLNDPEIRKQLEKQADLEISDEQLRSRGYKKEPPHSDGRGRWHW